MLVEETARWTAPVAYPTDGLIYQWDEALLDWVVLETEKEQTTN